MYIDSYTHITCNYIMLVNVSFIFTAFNWHTVFEQILSDSYN